MDRKGCDADIIGDGSMKETEGGRAPLSSLNLTKTIKRWEQLEDRDCTIRRTRP